MNKKFALTPRRGAEIFKEMLACRRKYCPDDRFFKMTDFWEWLCDDDEYWRINRYRSNVLDDHKCKAGVVEFGDRVTLTVDERLWTNAEDGCMFSNFILAHEAAHVGLDHHARGAVTKNFQLFKGPSGMSNIPPTLEELETNFAAVFLQCGMALVNRHETSLQLARRAFSDVPYVERSKRIVVLDIFQNEFRKITQPKRRVIL